MRLNRMHHATGRHADHAVLGGRIGIEREQQKIAGRNCVERHRDHMAAGVSRPSVSA